ncbi:uncharacterized protein [Palaemon carinicauda]|uniref:uncharacterized protein n=1 Tax=Palaemon carinicauda TaxID=392227 RepID=UPI0035B5D3A3
MMATFLWVPALFTLFLRDALGQNCGGVVDTTLHPSGRLASPGYPDHYPEDASCTWRIKAPHGEKVALEFLDFDVTGSDECSGDYVSILASERAEEQRFCGSRKPKIITSEGDTLVLTFASNAQGSCRGFNATYHVQEETLTCGAKTNALEFTFNSPSYPETVGNDSLECSVTIDHGCDVPICQLRLDFEDFQLQPPYWGNCKYDRFYAESVTPLPTLCGVNNGSHMYVNVQGRSKTDLTFLLSDLEYYLYHCYDIYGTNVLPNTGPADVDPHARRARRALDEDFGVPSYEEVMAYPEGSFVRQIVTGTTPPNTVGPTDTTSAVDIIDTTTNGDVTVALYNYKDADIVTFDTRRAWKVQVTQIPCDCPNTRVPKAPEGCLQYFQGLTGNFKSFNFDGVGCYSEDRWCDFSTIRHPSDCDIRVGYTGHLNDMDYSICIEPESGFCGIQYQQVGTNGFSLTNITGYKDDTLLPLAEYNDMGCMSDYLWVPGAENEWGPETYERFCGTKFGNARKWGTVSSYSKPFTVRMVTDSDEHSLSHDYMNKGFHISYSQIPCKLSG